MTKVEINGVRYVPADDSLFGDDEEERRELSEWIKSFTLEGDLFWKQRFENDSGTDAWNAGMYSEGDETAPFFTEAFLYNLLGKDDARSVLGIIRRLSALAGVECR